MEDIAFSWSIDNFVNRTERLIVSPRFTIVDHPQIEWRLELYPIGFCNETFDFVSLFLYKITDRFEVEVEYDLAMVGADVQVESKKALTGHKIFEIKNNGVNHGYYLFVSRSRVIKDLLINGILTIQVRNVQVIRVVELKNRLDATVFNWDIDNFVSKNANELTSDKFTIPGHSLVKWQLICYPNGFNDKNNGFLAIQIKKCTDDCEFEIEYQLTLVCGDDEKKSEITTAVDCFKKERTFFRWSKYISRDQLIEDGYLIDGTLKIQVKVFRVVQAVYHDDYFNHQYKKKSLDLDSFKQYDFRLKTNDQTFEAHKVMLARESQYFRGMFDGDLKENRENEVDLSQFKPDVIQEVLRFIYTGQLQNFDELSDQMIFAADYFQMDYLKILCQANMKFRISLDNCLQFLLIADQVNASLLKEAAMRFLNKSKNRIHKQVLRRFFKEQSELAFEWVFWSS